MIHMLSCPKALQHVLLWLMPCAGQGCSRRHPAADVAGEVGAAGGGD